MTFDLHNCLVGRTVDSKNHGETGHTLASDDGNLRLASLSSAQSDYRCQSSVDEADTVNLAFCSLQALSELERHRFKVRLKHLPIGSRKAAKDPVLWNRAYARCSHTCCHSRSLFG